MWSMWSITLQAKSLHFRTMCSEFTISYYLTPKCKPVSKITQFLQDTLSSHPPFTVFQSGAIALGADELHWELIISLSSHADAILTRGVIICKIPEMRIFGAYLDRMPAAPMSDPHLSRSTRSRRSCLVKLGRGGWWRCRGQKFDLQIGRNVAMTMFRDLFSFSDKAQNILISFGSLFSECPNFLTPPLPLAGKYRREPGETLDFRAEN